MIRDPITSRIRNTRRLADVLQVLARHGFGSFLSETGLDKVIGRGLEMISGKEEHPEAKRLPLEVRLRLVLEELGPIYMKLGQVLATRPDLIPPEVAREFRKLQSDCPKVPYEEIRERLDEQFNEKVDEVFAFIDEEPIAAASIAQAHRARLVDGTEVIIKVLRPGIEELVVTDLEVLEDIAEFTERHFASIGFSPSNVVKEFSRQINRETDLFHEARATERLHEEFKDTPGIHFTPIYWEATTRRVLAMREVKGQLLSRLKPGDLDPAVARQVVKNGTTAVFRMCLEIGFFHADPHPGNIFALEDGSICFIDCGMVGHVEVKTREDLLELVSSVLSRDLDRVLRSVIALSDAESGMERDRAFRADAWEIVSRFHVGNLERLDIAELLESFFTLLRDHKITCPSDLVFLIKALTTIQGVGELLDPEFDFVTHLQPRMRNLMRRQYGPGAIRKRLMRSLMGYIEVVEKLPIELRSLTGALHSRNFSVGLDIKGLEELRHILEKSAKIISIALILAAMIIGTSIHSRSPDIWGTLFGVFGLMTLAIAALFCGWLVLGLFRKD
ncbi:MAG: AarF/ABC1/UbiB kinase family protein [Candidatus Sumerlaeia bacterium]|nr:AarF/ABC1/UbiB kinase family protein [Candidatus Sumerlaeia bacterium]